MDYQQYLVSLELVSRRASLSQLSKVMGMIPSDYSHERGQLAKIGKRRWPTTIWKLASPASRSLDKQMSHIATARILQRVRAVKRQYADVSVILNIGILYRGAYGSVKLSSPQLIWCSHVGAEVHLAAYPCSEPNKRIMDTKVKTSKKRARSQ